MRKTLKSIAGVAGVAALAAGGLLLGTAVAASTTQNDTPTYAVNERGETFGSASGAASSASEPALIEAIATNGKVGYVKKSDLDDDPGLRVSSPEEALAYQERRAGASRTIPVYLEDGKTQIGEFIIIAGDAGEVVKDDR